MISAFNDTRVKSLTTWNVCIPMEAGLYDPPQYEHEVARKRHENANMGADCVSAKRGIIWYQILPPTSLNSLSQRKEREI